MLPSWTRFSRTGATAYLIGLALVAGAVFAVGYVLALGPHAPWPWTRASGPAATSVLLGFAEVTVAVLGVALTVVSILVELAANRYTPRITELFVRDRTNLLVLSFFVLVALLVVWFGLMLGEGDPPRGLVFAMVALLSTSLLALLPYFAFVFDFLAPERVVRHIAGLGLGALGEGLRRPASGREGLSFALDQLGDVAHKAVQSEDKGIAAASIRAIGEVAREAVRAKPQLPPAWFDAGDLLREDADFASFHPDVIVRTVSARVWAEMKALRQLQSVYAVAQVSMRDTAHLVAIETREVALCAARAGDAEALRLAMRFLNTYLRQALNARDVRSAYNLMQEVRALAEALLGTPLQPVLLDVAAFMKRYGQLAFQLKLSFVLETVAYDLGTLIEAVHAAGAPEHDALLALFLDVDREPDADAGQESALRGVRKAQVKLATWYLSVHEVERARRIHQDMRAESPARLAGIRADLEGTVEREFWEISDRGVNFDWLAPDRRAHLAAFFSWFDVP